MKSFYSYTLQGIAAQTCSSTLCLMKTPLINAFSKLKANFSDLQRCRVTALKSLWFLIVVKNRYKSPKLLSHNFIKNQLLKEVVWSKKLISNQRMNKRASSSISLPTTMQFMAPKAFRPRKKICKQRTNCIRSCH